MRVLNRKLLRDLRRMWSQALTIALVVASGIGGFITSLSAVDSLELARDRFYASARFANLFAGVKNAPLSLAARLREAPGVADVQTSIEQVVRIELAGVTEPLIGQLIGVERRHPPRMNLVSLAAGRALRAAGPVRADAEIEALVSEAFAQARALRPGSRLRALINGKQRSLLVVGIAHSPEFIFAGLWGMPDARGFGVFWVEREVLAAAYDMEGGFNRAAFTLAPGAPAPPAMAAIGAMLQAYGGRDVIARSEQVSHAMLGNEIAQQRVMGTILPAIFLGVAAFLLNVVVARMVSTQREQIATLKALGYGNAAISAHYLKFVLLIVGAGLLLGIAVGKQLGYLLTRLYAESFHFPTFEHRLAPALLLLSAAISIATACAGTLHAIAASARLAPAEAMRAPAPAHFRRTLLERLGIRAGGPALRMTLRNMERRPMRSLMACAGVAAAVAIIIMGNFFRDAIAVVIDNQFTLGLRGDIVMWTAEPVDDSVRLALRRLPGVRHVESLRYASVSIGNAQRRERTILRGYAGRPELYRVVDMAQRETLLEGRGLVLTDRLADKLGLKAGDPVRIEVLEGRPRTLLVPLQATVDEMFGLNAYMERRALNRLLSEGDLSTGFVMSVEPGAEARVLEASKALPRIAGAWSKNTMLANMEEITARNVRIMSTILTTFAVIIAVGVVYNNARIALSERAWELASLRVLGFTRAEVSAMLLGEMAIVIGLALPLGMLLGRGLVGLIAELMKSDQLHFPLVIQASTYAWAALAVLATGVASALVVRRHIDRLNLVEVLKTRE
ncbi:FtsX-like permease family protein [Massilia sp. DJPM01]|uniref:ABC transporter permease n=1 Tax=Massilia sp. DJPM01 TaxID=3024404 RepID=UPI00259E9F8C|nr:ABC transporter permease [Massilia sp. DJPM01]MDM5175670.1 FtsX-like permease family protein [Massilia sp. DJPM01]